MTKKTGNKEINYIISSHQEELPDGKKLNLFLEENRNKGHYYVYLKANKRVLFTNKQGYLFSEQLNQYKNNPSKYCYIERNSEGDYITVSIFNRQVFYEGKIAAERQVIKQLQILLSLDEEPASICVFGIKETSKIFEFLLSQEKKHTLTVEIAKNPISLSFAASSAFLTKRIGQTIVNRQFKVLIKLLLLVIIIIAGGYLALKLLERFPKKQVAHQEETDPYQDYKNKFRAPTALSITQVLSSKYQAISNQFKALWDIQSILYNGKTIIFHLTSKETDASFAPLKTMAKSLGMQLSTGSITQPNIHLSISHITHNKKIPSIIIPIKESFTHYLENLKLLYGKHLTYQNGQHMTKTNVYQSMSVSINMEKVNFNTILSALKIADGFPARIKRIDIRSIKPSTSFYSLSYQIAFYGD